jgi:hypothetical protein
VKVVNKTFDAIPVRVEVVEPRGTLKWVGNGISLLNQQDIAEGEFFIELDRSTIRSPKTKVKLHVIAGEELLEEVETSFIGPVN